METFYRICIKDFTLQGDNGCLELKRGKEYLTSKEEKEEVVIFTKYWVKVPVSLFAGEEQFTY